MCTAIVSRSSTSSAPSRCDRWRWRGSRWVEPDLGHDLLAQVIEEGMENPNSRPRCDDLVETLVAMAKAGIEPRPALTQRIREIVAGLGEPW